MYRTRYNRFENRVALALACFNLPPLPFPDIMTTGPGVVDITKITHRVPGLRRQRHPGYVRLQHVAVGIERDAELLTRLEG